MATRRLRNVARVGAFIGLGFLLSACLKLNMDLRVHDDDTVSGTVIFGFSKELLELTGQSPEEALGTDAPFPSDAEGVSVEPYEDSEFSGQKYTFENLPLTEFNNEGDPDALTIVREGETFVVSGALDLGGGTTGVTGATGFGEFLEGADLQVKITFPGEVLESNGQIDGNTVTWIPKVGERTQLSATGSAIDNGQADGGGGGSTLVYILIGAGVLIVIAIVVGVLATRKRGKETPPMADVVTGGPAAAPPASPMTETAPPPPAPPTGGDEPPPPPPAP